MEMEKERKEIEREKTAPYCACKRKCNILV